MTFEEKLHGAQQSGDFNALINEIPYARLIGLTLKRISRRK